MSGLPWIFDDGGRSKAPGFGGVSGSGDCVVRAVTIVTGRPYAEVYAELTDRQAEFGRTSRSREAKQAARQPQARHGVFANVFRAYMLDQGWLWVPTMKIGTGTTVHLRRGELPTDLGPLAVQVSRHLTAVVNGAVRDTHDPCRDGNRAVYGLFMKGGQEPWSPPG